MRITGDEAFILGDAERTKPVAYPNVFVAKDEFFHAADPHDPILDYVLDEGYRNVPVATGDSGGHGAGPSVSVASAPPFSAPLAASVPVPSTSGASAASTINDALRTTVISQFLQRAGLSEMISSDVAQKQGALQPRMDHNDGNQRGFDRPSS